MSPTNGQNTLNEVFCVVGLFVTTVRVIILRPGVVNLVSVLLKTSSNSLP